VSGVSTVVSLGGAFVVIRPSMFVLSSFTSVYYCYYSR